MLFGKKFQSLVVKLIKHLENWVVLCLDKTKLLLFCQNVCRVACAVDDKYYLKSYEVKTNLQFSFCPRDQQTSQEKGRKYCPKHNPTILNDNWIQGVKQVISTQNKVGLMHKNP